MLHTIHTECTDRQSAVDSSIGLWIQAMWGLIGVSDFWFKWYSETLDTVSVTGRLWSL